MAGRCGEVVTLQLGHYANHVGAHWWNLQEAESSQSQECEICSDVLFRRGVTLRGVETYTPRLIALDLKGSVRLLRDESSVYEDRRTRHSVPAWKGNVSVHREDPGTLQGEDGALSPGHDGETAPPPGSTEMTGSVWSDFLQTQFHPKSVHLVSSHSYGGDMDGLDSFSQGDVVFKTQLEEIEDRLHFFTEECDYLQGFHILCDLHNGFSGVGVRMAELLHDEYPGRGILSFGACPAPSGERDPCKAVYQLMNCLLALGPLSSHSSLFCPLSVVSSLGRRPGPPAAFPQLLYNAGVQYHSSAVLAVALNAVTTPYRMSSSGLSMLHFAEALTFGGRKMLSAACSVPFPLEPTMSLPDALLPHLSSAPWRSVSPCPDATAAFTQSVVLRGIPEQQHTSDLPVGTQPQSFLYMCENGEQVLQRYLQELCPRTLSMAHLVKTPCTLGPSFPQFFSPYVTTDGFTAAESWTTATAIGQIPVLSALQTSGALGQTLRDLCAEVSKVDMRHWLNFSTAAVEPDDFREAIEEVRSLAHCYREGGESDDSD
ncbi:protein misato homolog 1 [Dendropsophus ebraccatus]|uniref:protein misato homolog 1 n=1 Tax=Dendropsophus ebraccatus TaxID=150705 RepID=UPI00383170E1